MNHSDSRRSPLPMQPLGTCESDTKTERRSSYGFGATEAAPLELILGRELLEQRETLGEPLLELRGHRPSLHLLEALELSFDFLSALLLPFAGKLHFLVGAASAVRRRAQRSGAHLLDIRLHVLVVAKLFAHGLVRLFGVRFALVARLLVEVTNRGPAASAGAVRPADGLLCQVNVAERNLGVVLKRLRHAVPRRRLLFSSASALAGNPADEECLARVDLGLHKALKHVLCAFRDV
mmetsp:Transcript_36902/g.86224  ORF Transcript_36902/g.86224 Transcript_36902/m.86224 type:complete len:236 (-) Transcript_36902:93-800(-)